MSELRFGRQLYVYLVWDFYRKAFGHILVVGGSWFGLPHRNRGLYVAFRWWILPSMDKMAPSMDGRHIHG